MIDKSSLIVGYMQTKFESPNREFVTTNVRNVKKVCTLWASKPVRRQFPSKCVPISHDAQD